MASYNNNKNTVDYQQLKAETILRQLEIGDMIKIPPYPSAESSGTVVGTIVAFYPHFVIIEDENKRKVSITMNEFKTKKIEILHKNVSKASDEMFNDLMKKFI